LDEQDGMSDDTHDGANNLLHIIHCTPNELVEVDPELADVDDVENIDDDVFFLGSVKITINTTAAATTSAIAIPMPIQALYVSFV
jgi:hypothetical protein